MLPTPDPQKIRLQELIGKRKPLWKRFEHNPNDIHLALELKFIDDQIAECNQQIQSYKRKLKESSGISSSAETKGVRRGPAAKS